MIQKLFGPDSFPISPFGVMLVLAFLGSYLQLRWGLRKHGIGDEEDASALVFAAGVGGIVGAKIYYAILHGWQYLFDRSGLVWYGGFILGTLAVVFTMRRRRLPPWETLDAAAPALALGYAVGRIGCFLVGDDYGRPTDLPWGIAFKKGLPSTTAGELRREFGVDIPASIPDTEMLRVHPTQLYETLAGLLIWGFGLWLFRRGARPGTVALVLFGLLAIERFLVELIRVKDDRFLGPFTLAQAISIAVLLTVLVVGGLRFRRPAGARVSRPA